MLFPDLPQNARSKNVVEGVPARACRRVIVTFRRMLTIKETCERLRCHRATLYRLMAEDSTFPEPHYIRSRSPRFFKEDIDRWVRSRCATARNSVIDPYLFEGVRRGPRRKVAA